MNENQRQWDTLIKRVQYNWEHAWINGKECQKYLDVLEEMREIAKEYEKNASDMHGRLKYNFGAIAFISRRFFELFSEFKADLFKKYNECLKILKLAKDENKNYTAYLSQLTLKRDFDTYLNFFCNVIQNEKDFKFTKIEVIIDSRQQDVGNFDIQEFKDAGHKLRYYTIYGQQHSYFDMEKSLIDKMQKVLSSSIKQFVQAQKANLSKYDNITRPVERKHKISFEEFEDNAKANYLKGKRIRPHKKQAKGYAYLENSVRRMF